MALIEFQDLPDTTTPLNASNLNNNFEYLEGLNEYSTSEQVIGTWIDGKPLYRKTFTSTIANGSTEKTIPLGISNADVIYIDSGNSYINFTTGGSTVQLGFYSASTDWSRGYIASNNVVVQLGSVYSLGSKDICVTVKYTKTTD